MILLIITAIGSQIYILYVLYCYSNNIYIYIIINIIIMLYYYNNNNIDNNIIIIILYQ